MSYTRKIYGCVDEDQQFYCNDHQGKRHDQHVQCCGDRDMCNQIMPITLAPVPTLGSGRLARNKWGNGLRYKYGCVRSVCICETCYHLMLITLPRTHHRKWFPGTSVECSMRVKGGQMGLCG